MTKEEFKSRIESIVKYLNHYSHGSNSNFRNGKTGDGGGV